MTGFIEVRGAREHNLKDVSLRIPKRAITVVTGVSGSGKSSLVIDTIGAEAQRQLREQLGLAGLGEPIVLRRPDADAIEHLGLTVVVDQRRLTGGPGITVGTATDIARLLDRLFAGAGRPAGAPRVDGYARADMDAMTIGDLVPILRLLDGPVASELIAPLVERLTQVASIGLDHLSLDRPVATLSGGEAQRIKLTRALGSSLEDVIFLIDEPSVGLHARDVCRVGELLLALRDRGNTVIVVDHDPAVIAIADHVVDLGPGAGAAGGRVVFEGTVADLRHAGTRTGMHLDRVTPMRTTFRAPTGWLEIRDARTHTLRGLDVDVPTGVLTVVTGVAGSGKSSLVHGELVPRHPDAVVIDQAPLAVAAGADVATAAGVMDGVLAAFATVAGVDPAAFRLDGAGSCPSCGGSGVRAGGSAEVAALRISCEACGGRRFAPSVLQHTLDGWDVSEVLALSAGVALETFSAPGAAPAPRVVGPLQALVDIGLGYLRLDQRTETLSGGEAQRLKLAAELHRAGGLLILDEPTTGLHPSDTGRLLAVLGRLVDAGGTVVVIEHDLDVIRAADWVIDLGPDGGSKGGRLVFTGTPAALLRSPESHTAEALRRAEGTAPPPDVDTEVQAMLAFLRGDD